MYVITGGSGFIGSAFVRKLHDEWIKRKGRILLPDHCLISVLSKRTGVSNLKSLKGTHDKCVYDDLDLNNYSKLCSQVRGQQMVVHFAAESHVQKSIEDPTPFIQSNVVGTMNLLNACMDMHVPKVILVSSCEVYGETSMRDGSQRETCGLSPKSPYAASKAGADVLAQSYIHTYRAPIVIVRPCNNYGPWQHPEKVVPRFVQAALGGQDLTIHGDGKQTREWIYVDDCVEAIWEAQDLQPGVYNIGSGEIISVQDIARMVLAEIPTSPSRIINIPDRPGQVTNFMLNSEKFRLASRGAWTPKVSFKEGIARTVKWYEEHGF